MDTETKTLSLELKADSDEGAFRATFATFNVIDHHGDVTKPGAFESGAETLVGAYMHDLGALPTGKGTIGQDGDRAFIEGKFWLDTPQGEATYRTVKNAGGILEWSYVFQPTQVSRGEWEDGDGVKRPVRFLEKIDVWSVDPVLKGAGINTRTDSIKSHPISFADNAGELVTAVTAFVERAESRIEMRAKEGRTLSADDRERIDALVTGLDELKARLAEALRSDEPKATVDLQDAVSRYLRTEAARVGFAVST